MVGQVYAALNETIPESLKKRKIHHHIDFVDKDSIYSIKTINMLNEKFVLSKINKRIEIATKLKTIGPHASEDYQVANYGLGNKHALNKYDRFSLNTGRNWIKYYLYQLLFCPFPFRWTVWNSL